MELTREIYWNVGQGVLLPMYLLMALAFAVLGWGLWQRIRVYRQGRPLDRGDGLKDRVSAALGDVFSQARVLRGHGPGMAHAFFFWGFLVLTAGTTLIFIQEDFSQPLLNWRFLSGGFYLLFSLALDLAGIVALLMLFGLALRRWVLKPAGLPRNRDDVVMHALLVTILVTGFLIEGARMAVTELGTPLASWSPGGLLVAKVLEGFDPALLRGLHTGLWWLHLLLAGAFFACIPFTRLRHLFTTGANYVFEDHRPLGAIATPNLEDESATSFGLDHVADLTWKDIFDGDACTLCKRCQDRCPAWATGKPLSPMKVVNQLRDAAFATPDASLVDTVERDVIWACTTCRACQETCPAAIEHVNKLLELRRHLALMAGEFPGPEVATAMSHTEVNGNPLGLAFAGRGDWAAVLGVKTLAEDPEVDLLYFVGCYASFDQRNLRVAKSFVALCQAAGLKVGILGKEEKCCGEPMRKLGNEYLYQTVAAENIERFRRYGVKRIVATCPHCFHTLGRAYRDLGLDLPVEHHSVFLTRLLRDGKLPLAPGEPFDCTYHDSCYIGRYGDIFDAPRVAVRAAGGMISEMEKHRLESFCCGGGGGRILAEEKLGSRISETRVKMAAATGTGVLAANCPFCLSMFEDGIKGAGLEGELVVRDIAELLAERLRSGGG